MTPPTLEVREYGSTGHSVVLVHGGPGAPGYLRPLALALQGSFRVREPFQRRSGGPPLTVSTHVADLHEVVMSCASPPALVGHSWGAMLSLAYAATHPTACSALVLVGCGTFDRRAREQLAVNRERLTDDSLRRKLAELPRRIADPDERLRRLGELLMLSYSYRPTSPAFSVAWCDARGHEESWADMVRLQDEGVYPAAFSAVTAPVIMLHGAADPHPGRLIRDGLRPHLPSLEYREWELCGHCPWVEEEVGAEFVECLRDWLERRRRNR